MRTSGGTGGFVKPPTGRTLMLGGGGALTAGAQTAGGLRLYAVNIPFQTAFQTLGFFVSGAGDAASTMTPVLFAVAANGDPGVPIYTGNALSTAAGGLVSGGPAGVFPAGPLWVGALCLSPGVAPTVSNVGRLDDDPRGPFNPTDTLASASLFPFQSGLAAVPNPWAGTYIANAAPLLYVTL